MIVTERYPGSENLVRTYSDRHMKIRQEQTGNIYDEAVDVESMGYTYAETDIPIHDEELTDTEALNVIMGRGLDYEPDNSNDIPEND